MSSDVSFLDDLDLDRKFLNVSASMANIFSWTYGWLGTRLIAPIDPKKFDNASSTIGEIGVRALIVLGALASFLLAGTTYILLGAIVLSAGSKICRGLGYYFQKNGSTHVRGQASEKQLENGHAKIMEWNIRGHGYKEGGVRHWRSRLDRIVNTILSEDADIIVLQEVYDTLLIEALIERLENQYAHFYTHLGANVWGQESGIMVITKCAVHKFLHTDFSKTDDKVKRSFEMLEIKAGSDKAPCARIIGTQLSPGKTAADLRASQIGQVIDTLYHEKTPLPTLFVGSLNIDRNSPELPDYFFHSYLDDNPTHSKALENQWAPVFEGEEESSDFISLVKRKSENDCRTFPVLEKGIRLVDSHLGEAFEIDPELKLPDTRSASSDHRPVITEVSGLKNLSE